MRMNSFHWPAFNQDYASKSSIIPRTMHFFSYTITQNHEWETYWITQ
jgi:hypothetical protein